MALSRRPLAPKTSTGPSVSASSSYGTLRYDIVLCMSAFLQLAGGGDVMLVKLEKAGVATEDGLPSPVALQIRAPPKVSARAPAHRSYHFRGVKLKSCIKKIHHNLYISKQANVRIKHADTEGASHKKIGTDARVQ